jgi:hypothetical protein
MRATAPLRLAAGLLAVACHTERIDPGPARAATAEDSAVLAALDTYYDRFSRRDWPAFRASFWPGAVIAVRWVPPGATDTVVALQTLERFLAGTPDGADRLAVFEERRVHHELQRYGDLAVVWATFRATFGLPGETTATHYGVDAFQLLRHHGEWRIVSLAFTPELAARPLPKDS